MAASVFAASRLAARTPELVESAYCRVLYPVLGQGLNLITGLVPVSLAELIAWSFPVLGLAWLMATIRSVRLAGRPERLSLLGRRAAWAMASLCVVYVAFMVSWGFNYARRPFASIAGLEVRPAPVEELVALCEILIDEANALRLEVREGPDGVMALEAGAREALRRAQPGYDRAAAVYPVLGGRYGPPKGVLSSVLMCYAGWAGVYFPFTGEANVNVAMPALSIPFTACHEMAHQRGFAREDEANYIGYLACRLHPDPDFRYSGVVSAATEAMEQLYRSDPSLYARLEARYSERVRRDLKASSSFWEAYEGPASRALDRVNDSYLKVNGQSDGMRSYGRMVDLLLAEYRKRESF